MRLLVAALIFSLVGCSRGGPPAPQQAATAATESGALLALPMLMQAPERWIGLEILVVAALDGPDGRVLSSALLPGSNGVTLVDDPRTSLWLSEPLPAAMQERLRAGPNYLKLRGRLSPPGAYGTDARYLYQFSVAATSVLQPERAGLARVADNPRAFEGALLEMEGLLLAGAEGTLIVDTASAGGVPAPNARQIKLRDLIDQQIPADLQQSGAVRFGPVRVTGWWHEGVLTPFLVRARP